MQQLCSSDGRWTQLLTPLLPASLSLAQSAVSPSFRRSAVSSLAGGGLSAALHAAEVAEWSGLMDEALFALYIRHSPVAAVSGENSPRLMTHAMPCHAMQCSAVQCNTRTATKATHRTRACASSH